MYSYTHILIYSYTHILIYSYTHSYTHILTYSCTHILIRSCTDILIHTYENTILYYTTLYYTILYDTILYYTMLYLRNMRIDISQMGSKGIILVNECLHSLTELRYSTREWHCLWKAFITYTYIITINE